MSFMKTKDRLWVGYNLYARWLAHRSAPVRKAGYWIFGGVLWIAYLMPRSNVRATYSALAIHVRDERPSRLFGNFVRGFVRGMDRTEQVRHGFTDEIDRMLKIPDQQRLDALLEKQGVMLVIPHASGSLAMGCGLAKRYPALALVRATKNERRGAAEHQVYKRWDGEYIDVRHENPTMVARKVLKALNQKKLVIGTVDRISNAPPEDAPIDSKTDTIRAKAFAEPIGVGGWPARFAQKSKAPIIPAIVDQTEDGMSLILGDTILPTCDLIETSQAWVSELEKHMRGYPDEWAFALDKHWSRVLRESSKKVTS